MFTSICLTPGDNTRIFAVMKQVIVILVVSSVSASERGRPGSPEDVYSSSESEGGRGILWRGPVDQESPAGSRQERPRTNQTHQTPQ